MSMALLALTLLCAGADPAETTKKPETMLYVRTMPSGAEIRLDGKSLGTSDGLFPVKAGNYKIVLDLAGFQPEEQQITVRDGRITRIELTLRSRGKVAESPEGQSGPSAATPGPNVIEGVGWGGFRVGATREELVKAYGSPDPNPGNPWVRWTSRYHVDCLFDHRGGAQEVRFNQGFPLPLTAGIRIGSSESEVLTAYGKPSRVVDNPQAKMLEYGSRGVLMWIMDGKVFDFTVFKPYAADAQPVQQTSAEAATPAQAVAEGQSILKNSGIEAGDKTPDGWQKGAAIPGVKYSWDRQVAFEGKASLSIEKTAQRYFPIAQWSQTVERQGDQPALLVSAQVKAKNMTKAIVDVVFLDANSEWISHKWVAYIGIQKEGDPPADHDWKPYSGKVEIPPQTKRLLIGLQVYGPGKVWFDDVRAGYAK
jgi:hypothetical protein